MDERVISSATLHYELILCLDPILYARHLQRINLPIIMAATTKEIHDYPEILDVTDYLLPVPGSRHDVALRQLIAEQILLEDSGTSAGKKTKVGNYKAKDEPAEDAKDQKGSEGASEPEASPRITSTSTEGDSNSSEASTSSLTAGESKSESSNPESIDEAVNPS